MTIITVQEVSHWMSDPMIEQGAESDYWDTILKVNPDAMLNFDLVLAFLWIRKYIKSLTN